MFDVAGRCVRSLLDGTRAEGRHAVVWDGRDDRGAPVAAGLYLYRLVTPENTEVRKMMIAK